MPVVASRTFSFLLTPLREGRRSGGGGGTSGYQISTHAPAGGATYSMQWEQGCLFISTHAPAGGATETRPPPTLRRCISTHAPAGGATYEILQKISHFFVFLLTPLREGRRGRQGPPDGRSNFYSRPCGRGDEKHPGPDWSDETISTHAPAGGATRTIVVYLLQLITFLLTPLREGRRKPRRTAGRREYFYSRPCGRGDAGEANC